MHDFLMISLFNLKLFEFLIIFELGQISFCSFFEASLRDLNTVSKEKLFWNQMTLILSNLMINSNNNSNFEGNPNENISFKLWNLVY